MGLQHHRHECFDCVKEGNKWASLDLHFSPIRAGRFIFLAASWHFIWLRGSEEGGRSCVVPQFITQFVFNICINTFSFTHLSLHILLIIRSNYIIMVTLKPFRQKEGKKKFSQRVFLLPVMLVYLKPEEPKVINTVISNSVYWKMMQNHYFDCTGSAGLLFHTYLYLRHFALHLKMVELPLSSYILHRRWCQSLKSNQKSEAWSYKAFLAHNWTRNRNSTPEFLRWQHTLVLSCKGNPSSPWEPTKSTVM